MTKTLFNEFDQVSAKQWKQKIQVDLKGADYNDTLLWQSAEGINVKPFYHADDFESSPSPILGHPTQWSIAQDIFIDDESIANKLMLDATKRGAESIMLTSEKEFDFSVTLLNFPFENVKIYFYLKFISETFITQLKEYLKEQKATVFYNIDIIGNLVSTGNWFHNLKSDHEILEKILQKNPEGNILSVDTCVHQNAGANMTQQLAYALAQATEYLNHFTSVSNNKGLMKNLKMTFQVAIGSNYFFEIAKIRALRKLYAIIAKEFDVTQTCHIVARPTKRNKTIYDYNINMLRTTTECMSAILGGADTICNLSYDALYHKSNEFGERISRNQLSVLKAESYFDAVSNPADGTYYIESLTSELSEKALEIFKDIEVNGGFLSQLKEGIILRKIKESASKEQHLFDNGTLVLLGTNKFINENDKMKNDLELFPFVKTNIRKTLIEPVIERRLSEKLEQTRLKNEQN
ncbi:MAG: methylmalonyl-CoA mutase [Sediminicola sp.]|jgi:methylmalonyl-CoA mutase